MTPEEREWEKAGGCGRMIVSDFLRGWKNHPGKFTASAMLILSVVACGVRQEWEAWVIGSLWFIPVIITSYTHGRSVRSSTGSNGGRRNMSYKTVIAWQEAGEPDMEEPSISLLGKQSASAFPGCIVLANGDGSVEIDRENLPALLAFLEQAYELK